MIRKMKMTGNKHVTMLDAALKKQAQKTQGHVLKRYFDKFGVDKNWAETARELAQKDDKCKENAILIFTELGMKEDALECLESIGGDCMRQQIYEQPAFLLHGAHASMKRGDHMVAARLYHMLKMENKVLECAKAIEKKGHFTNAAEIYLKRFEVPQREEAVRCAEALEKEKEYRVAMEIYKKLGMERELAQAMEKEASKPFVLHEEIGIFSCREIQKDLYEENRHKLLNDAASIYQNIGMLGNAARIREQLTTYLRGPIILEKEYLHAAELYSKAGKKGDVLRLIDSVGTDQHCWWDSKVRLRARMYMLIGESETAAKVLLDGISTVRERGEVLLAYRNMGAISGEPIYGKMIAPHIKDGAVAGFKVLYAELCLERGMKKEAADTLSSIKRYASAAKLYVELGIHDSAVECAEKLEAMKPIGMHIKEVIDIYNMMGMKDKAFESATSMGDFDLALKMLDEMEPIN